MSQNADLEKQVLDFLKFVREWAAIARQPRLHGYYYLHNQADRLIREIEQVQGGRFKPDSPQWAKKEVE